MTDKESEGSEGSNVWVFNATKPGIYPFYIENLDTTEATCIIMASFTNCTLFKTLVSKDEMEIINQRAERAIGSLFHNIVELEQSETRLNRRKESKVF